MAFLINSKNIILLSRETGKDIAISACEIGNANEDGYAWFFRGGAHVHE
jgi:hypothetical protein